MRRLCSHRRIRLLLVSAVTAVILVGVAILFFLPRTLDRLNFPAETRPMTSDDRLPPWFTGSRPPDLHLGETRRLGEADGKPVYLSMDSLRTTVCVVIVDDEKAIGGGCGSHRDVAKSGLWVSVVDGSGREYTAVVMPIEYPTLEVPATVDVLLRNREVVVVRTPRVGAELVLRGQGLRPIVIPIKSFN